MKKKLFTLSFALSLLLMWFLVGCGEQLDWKEEKKIFGEQTNCPTSCAEGSYCDDKITNGKCLAIRKLGDQCDLLKGPADCMYESTSKDSEGNDVKAYTFGLCLPGADKKVGVCNAVAPPKPEEGEEEKERCPSGILVEDTPGGDLCFPKCDPTKPTPKEAGCNAELGFICQTMSQQDADGNEIGICKAPCVITDSTTGASDCPSGTLCIEETGLCLPYKLCDPTKNDVDCEDDFSCIGHHLSPKGGFCISKCVPSADNPAGDCTTKGEVCQPVPGVGAICNTACKLDPVTGADNCPAGAVCNTETGICGITCNANEENQCAKFTGLSCLEVGDLSPTGGFCMLDCILDNFDKPEGNCKKRGEVCQPVPGVGAICKPPYAAATECPAGAVLKDGVCGWAGLPGTADQCDALNACVPVDVAISPTGGLCMLKCDPAAPACKTGSDTVVEVCQPVPDLATAICKPPYALATECPAGAVIKDGVCGWMCVPGTADQCDANTVCYATAQSPTGGFCMKKCADAATDCKKGSDDVQEVCQPITDPIASKICTPPCGTDDDCGDAALMNCIESQGLCSLRCTPGDAAKDHAYCVGGVEAGYVCQPDAQGSGFCMPKCDGSNEVATCGETMECIDPFAGGNDVCLPSCETDGDACDAKGLVCQTGITSGNFCRTCGATAECIQGLTCMAEVNAAYPGICAFACNPTLLNADCIAADANWVCQPLAATEGFCRTKCTADTDCSYGTVCNETAGICATP